MMKTFKTIALALMGLALVGAAHAGDFLTDYETAKKKATEENKVLVVKFTGSDWCAPCKALDKAIYSKKDFKTQVEKDFVVAVLDFPRKKKLPEGQLKKNEAVRDEFGVRGYPTVLVINQKGKVLKKMVGYSYTPKEGEENVEGAEVKAYLQQLKNAVKASRFF
jgi:thioredoxin-related protein